MHVQSGEKECTGWYSVAHHLCAVKLQMCDRPVRHSTWKLLMQPANINCMAHVWCRVPRRLAASSSHMP